jgi:hypothetical protein
MEANMKVGDKIIIRDGASEWMKARGYWLEEMGKSIDGFGGTISGDYTDLSGDDAHYAVDIGFDFEVGVNPEWLIKVKGVMINDRK